MRLLKYLALAICLVSKLLILSAQANVDFAPITPENVQNLQEIRSRDSDEWTYTVALSPDGTELAISRNDAQIEFISTETLETLRTANNIQVAIHELAYNQAGTALLIYGDYGGYQIIDPLSGLTFTSHINSEESNQFLFFEPSGDFKYYRLSDSQAHTAELRDMLTGEMLLSFDNALGGYISPNNRYFAIGKCCMTVQVWDIATKTLALEITEPDIADVYVDSSTAFGFSPDGLVWVNWVLYSLEEGIWDSLWDSRIQFWDVQQAHMVNEFRGDKFYLNLIFEPSGKWLWARGLDHTFNVGCSIWRISDPQATACPVGVNYFGLQFSPDGELMLVVCYRDDGINCKSANVLLYSIFYNFYDYLVVNNVTSPNIAIYDAEAQRLITILATAPTGFVAFTPDMRLLITVDELGIHLWAVPDTEH